MCLSIDQEAALHEFKEQMGMDVRLGGHLSNIRGSKVTAEQGAELSREHFNPALNDVIRQACPGRR